jgi:hypothetical protein
LGSRVLAGVVVALCAVIEVSLITYGHAEVALRATPAVLLVAVGMVALFWIPQVELDPHRLRLINPLRRYTINWPAITEIESRWSLSVRVGARSLIAWSAPAPGPFSQLGRLRRDAYNRVSLGDRTTARGAEQTRQLVIAQWESHRDDPPTDDGPGFAVRWNIPLTAALILLSAATICAIAWP